MSDFMGFLCDYFGASPLEVFLFLVMLVMFIPLVVSWISVNVCIVRDLIWVIRRM